MQPAYYEINIIRSIPDQEFSTSLNGLILNMRLYFSDTTQLWWLAIHNSDRTVTLSHICLRPGVWHPLVVSCLAIPVRVLWVLLVCVRTICSAASTPLMGHLACFFDEVESD
jgi:hypothetical protein